MVTVTQPLQVVCGKQAGAFTCLLDETGRYDFPEYANVNLKPDFKVSSLTEVYSLLNDRFDLAPWSPNLLSAKTLHSEWRSNRLDTFWRGLFFTSRKILKKKDERWRTMGITTSLYEGLGASFINIFHSHVRMVVVWYIPFCKFQKEFPYRGWTLLSLVSVVRAVLRLGWLAKT